MLSINGVILLSLVITAVSYCVAVKPVEEWREEMNIIQSRDERRD